VEAEILEFAYNSVQFQGITTPATATPEPGEAALGLLASGAAGLLAWRRRRAAWKAPSRVSARQT
jgi:LPXTG-motif cell wall-anchored protein